VTWPVPARFALYELQRMLQRHLPCVSEVREGLDEALRAERHLAQNRMALT